MKTDRGSSAIPIWRSYARTSGLANSFTRLLASYPQITQITQNKASHKEAPKPQGFFLIHSSLLCFLVGSFSIFHAYLRNLRIRSNASLCYTASARLVGQSARQNAQQLKYQAVNG